MSRILMVLVLAILLGLLAVMAQIVNPKPPPPPTAAEQEAKQKEQQGQQKKAMEQEKKERVNMMKIRDTKAKEWAEKQKKIEQKYATKKLPASSIPTEPAPIPSATSMDISHDWFKKRQDGEQGLKALEKMQKELEAAEKQKQPTAPPAGSVAKPVAPH